MAQHHEFILPQSYLFMWKHSYVSESVLSWGKTNCFCAVYRMISCSCVFFFEMYLALHLCDCCRNFAAYCRETGIWVWSQLLQALFLLSSLSFLLPGQSASYHFCSWSQVYLHWSTWKAGVYFNGTSVSVVQDTEMYLSVVFWRCSLALLFFASEKYIFFGPLDSAGCNCHGEPEGDV